MSYPEFVRSRFKSGEAIAKEMTPHKASVLLRSIQYLLPECDLLDRAKKYAIYNNQDVRLGLLGFDDCFEDLQLTPAQCELLHAAIGIAGEAGELLDTVRKHVFDGQSLDRENVIEELGDLCFYLEAACQSIATKREDIEGLNMAKLTKRYKHSYSDQQAKDRADKGGAE